MARLQRQTIPEIEGGYHVISRTAGQRKLLKSKDKTVFVNLLHHFAKVYCVELHAYCVMDTHFHLLVTMKDYEAENFSREQLIERHYTLTIGCSHLWPQKTKPIEASFEQREKLFLDAKKDKVIERLSSISRFVQDLKQNFSRYYNKTHKRKGTLWSERFKGVLISHGPAQLNCSAYIDLNPFRAAMVKLPEDYKWSSMGLIKSNKVDAEEKLSLIEELKHKQNPREYYKKFVYQAANLENPEPQLTEQNTAHSKQTLNLTKRISNLSEGIIFGTYNFVKQWQENMKRKIIHPRKLFLEKEFFVTRIYQTI